MMGTRSMTWMGVTLCVVLMCVAQLLFLDKTLTARLKTFISNSYQMVLSFSNDASDTNHVFESDVPEYFIIMPGVGEIPRCEVALKSLIYLQTQLKAENHSYVCDTYIYDQYEAISEKFLSAGTSISNVNNHGCSLHNVPGFWTYYLQQYFNYTNKTMYQYCKSCSSTALKIFYEKEPLDSYQYVVDNIKDVANTFVIIILDDVEIVNFNVSHATYLMKKYNIDVLSPRLTTRTKSKSQWTGWKGWNSPVYNNPQTIGITHGVEIQFHLLTFEAYMCWSALLDVKTNERGMGYDVGWKSLCNLTFGIYGQFEAIHRADLKSDASKPTQQTIFNHRSQFKAWLAKYDLNDLVGWKGSPTWRKFMKLIKTIQIDEKDMEVHSILQKKHFIQ